MYYADVEFYLEWLSGRKPQLPTKEFLFWERKARVFIDLYTFNRIRLLASEDIPEDVRNCVCELAEYLYINEGNENKQSESVSGRSATYLQGAEYRLCQRNLAATNLMYRGSK